MQPTASDDEQTSAPSVATRDFSMMSEDEQVAYAMQMSMNPTSTGIYILFATATCFKSLCDPVFSFVSNMIIIAIINQSFQLHSLLLTFSVRGPSLRRPNSDTAIYEGCRADTLHFVII